MTRRAPHPTDREPPRIGRLRAWALEIWGPAESWDHPLVGTEFDPALRHRMAERRRDEREARRSRHRQARRDKRYQAAHVPDEHCTPDAD